jgi:hypothetical protein
VTPPGRRGRATGPGNAAGRHGAGQRSPATQPGNAARQRSPTTQPDNSARTTGPATPVGTACPEPPVQERRSASARPEAAVGRHHSGRRQSKVARETSARGQSRNARRDARQQAGAKHRNPRPARPQAAVGDSGSAPRLPSRSSEAETSAGDLVGAGRACWSRWRPGPNAPTATGVRLGGADDPRRYQA